VHPLAVPWGVRERIDIAVVGAGAAGLMAAIQAARAGARVVAFDGARRLGLKILVAGGGRCNVTHERVDERDFCGSTRPAIRKVLSRFGVAETVGFFRGLGVELKREETGKLFPVSDDAGRVLGALLGECARLGVELRFPCRVSGVSAAEGGFVLADEGGESRARRVILATGGKALPKSGSDGGGYAIAQALGHSITPRVFPALVPLTLSDEPIGAMLKGLSGVSCDATLEVRSGTGKRLERWTGAVLCAHFGLSGPAPMNISRHLAAARADDPGARLVIDWAPGHTPDSIAGALVAAGGASVLVVLRAWVPERLAGGICGVAGVAPGTVARSVPREARRRLATLVAEMPVPVTGDRGFAFAECTAGGVPLSELRLDTLESRVCPGLHLCGEVLDVDGRIGGFNFQWAWASGFVAGRGAGRSALGSGPLAGA